MMVVTAPPLDREQRARAVLATVVGANDGVVAGCHHQARSEGLTGVDYERRVSGLLAAALRGAANLAEDL